MKNNTQKMIYTEDILLFLLITEFLLEKSREEKFLTHQVGAESTASGSGVGLTVEEDSRS